jgi:hypothetical protein
MPFLQTQRDVLPAVKEMYGNKHDTAKMYFQSQPHLVARIICNTACFQPRVAKPVNTLVRPRVPHSATTPLFEVVNLFCFSKRSGAKLSRVFPDTHLCKVSF